MSDPFKEAQVRAIAQIDDMSRWLVGMDHPDKPKPRGEVTQMLVDAGARIKSRRRRAIAGWIFLAAVYVGYVLIHQFGR